MNLVERLEGIRISGHPLTRDQKVGLLKMGQWLQQFGGGRFMPEAVPVFRAFGLAGTGKTSMSVSVKQMGFNPLYIAFTNRAVSILSSKGCTPARTMHSLLYEVAEYTEEEKHADRKLREAYIDAVAAGVPPEERPPMPQSDTRTAFTLRDRASLDEAIQGFDCIVVDEASMVGKRAGADLRKIGLPIIGVGDPGQLKPVGDVAMFNPNNPDVMLKEVLRTDGDILDLAMWVRSGKGFAGHPGDGEDFAIRRKCPPEWFDEADQVLCGIHDKRKELNRHIRARKGMTGFLPNVGEKLVAVANNRDMGIYNGTLWTVLSSRQQGDYAVMDLVEFAPAKATGDLEMCFGVEVHTGCFVEDINNSESMGAMVRKGSCLMTWGWAITVHKSQGSEWPTVVLFDDSRIFRDQVKEWAYTGATRAAKKLYVISRH